MQHYISTCKLCAKFLPNRVLTKPMHLDIPNMPFAGCAVDSIYMLPTITKGHNLTLTFICLLTFYVIAVPIKKKDSIGSYNCVPEGNITKNIMQFIHFKG